MEILTSVEHIKCLEAMKVKDIEQDLLDHSIHVQMMLAIERSAFDGITGPFSLMIIH